ncbi:MAG: hypothetical protein A2580_18105 [Hydrogenophilales bacterium RIFOXYD1_FULL_62_11]|nr:MAG: hypothetical protein A2580_18105 [Hydrogenophilales bacterium RIFOXYD1_FULL_62_11]
MRLQTSTFSSLGQPDIGLSVVEYAQGEMTAVKHSFPAERMAEAAQVLGKKVEESTPIGGGVSTCKATTAQLFDRAEQLIRSWGYERSDGFFQPDWVQRHLPVPPPSLAPMAGGMQAVF